MTQHTKQSYKSMRESDTYELLVVLVNVTTSFTWERFKNKHKSWADLSDYSTEY